MILKMNRIVLSIVSLFLISIMPLAAQTDASSSGYVIQPNDLLEINVFKNPDLTREVTVQPDGRISIPTVQDVMAAGLTQSQLKEAIEIRLKEFLDVPNVTVLIKAIQSYRIYVIGKVQKQGLVVSEKPLTVLQALTLAGGFQDYAHKDEITIIRTPSQSSGQTAMTLTFSYADVVKGDTKRQNVLLNTGDVVQVP